MVHALEYPLLKRSGRLAQLVAHPLDVREVTSSSLVSSTIEIRTERFGFFFYSWQNRPLLPKKVEDGFSGPVFLLIISLIKNRKGLNTLGKMGSKRRKKLRF